MSGELYSTSALHRYVRYDARREILSSVGDLSSLELFGSQLIVAPYVQSGIMFSDRLGIPETEVLSVDALDDLYKSGKGLLTQQFSKESIWQGKVLLLLKIGTEVDVSDPKWGEAPLQVGDWVYALQENTRQVSIRMPGAKQSRVLKALGVDYIGYPCKFLYAADIYGRVSDPNILV